MNQNMPDTALNYADVKEGNIAWRSPSNIAIIKYWGKYGQQLPRNPSISFTLSHATTDMQFYFKLKEKKDDQISLRFDFEERDKIEKFRLKMVQYLESVRASFPFLPHYDLHITSSNSFPHSAGIASSASSMSALALCLCSFEEYFFEEKPSHSVADYATHFYKKASYFARLASGSACRSVYPTLGLWGETPEVDGSSNEYAVPYLNPVNPIFTDFHDAILIASRGEKSVSSRMGHGLMDGNPFAEPRYAQARARLSATLSALKTGDVETFGQICEDEALTLHALMMTCSPSFTLLKPNTLKMIEILRGYRESTKTPVFFSLDAGPNLHVLYPNAVAKEVRELIDNELVKYCENGQVIYDKVGKGATQIS